MLFVFMCVHTWTYACMDFLEYSDDAVCNFGNSVCINCMFFSLF